MLVAGLVQIEQLLELLLRAIVTVVLESRHNEWLEELHVFLTGQGWLAECGFGVCVGLIVVVVSFPLFYLLISVSCQKERGNHN